MRLVPVFLLGALVGGCSVGEQVTQGTPAPGGAGLVADVQAPPGDVLVGASGHAPVSAPSLPGEQAPAVSFAPLAEIPVVADGVALNDNGGVAHAGLGDVSCDVYPATGAIGSDYYDLGNDAVLDAGSAATLGAVFLTKTPGQLHVHPVNSGYTEATFALGGVQDARLTSQGFVAVSTTTQGCMAGWFTDSGVLLSTLHFEGSCDGSFTADPVSGLAWLATDSGVLELAPGASRVIDPTPDAVLGFLSHDTQPSLVIGSADGILTMLELDGSTRWSADLGGAIEAVAGDPANGAVFAAVDTFQRRVVMLDGADAEELGGFDYAWSARHLAVSGDGGTVALATEGTVAFHTVLDDSGAGAP
ncbi:MAG: hypothetical protein R3F61_10440 [Myxococcota bacterium]